MKKLLTVTFTILALVNSSWAVHTAIIGGVRDGMALGMLVNEHVNDNLMYRFGVEGSTGDDLSFSGVSPLILFAGGSLHLMDLGWSPVSLGLEIVGEYGNNTEYGPAVSLIINKLYNQDPWFFELGVDYLGKHGHVVAQVGYRILEERSF